MCAVDGQSVAAVTNKKVPYVLQLEVSPLRLPTLHSGSRPALRCMRTFNFSGNIYAHLKFTVYGRKQEY